MEDFQILPRRVEDLQDLPVLHHVEKRREIEPPGQGIDNRLHPVGRRLNQAENRPVGFFAHEFGVDGDERLSGEFGGKVGEGLGV